MKKKITLMLTKSAEKKAKAFETALAVESERVLALLPNAAQHRRAIHLVDDPTQKIAHASEMIKAPPAFDAVFQIESDYADWQQLTPAIQGIAKRLGGLVDSNKSAAIAGTEHIIVPGVDYSLMLIMPLRRIPSLSSTEFHIHWLQKHAEIARRVPGLQNYRQIHADQSATIEVAHAAGVGVNDFEGHVESYWKSIDDFMRLMSQAEVTSDAIEDEKKFIDHSRSSLGLYIVM